MSSASITFDHVHLVCKDPNGVARWFVEKLGGTEKGSSEVQGAPQIYVAFDGATVIVRGQRTGESAGEKTGLQWGTDHFAYRVNEDFKSYCAGLKENGVKFTVEPTQFNPTTEIAFIEAPGGVSIELLHRSG